MPHAHRRALIGLWIACLLAAACAPAPNGGGGPPLAAGFLPAPTRTPFQPFANTPLPETPAPSASAASLPAPPAGIGLWLDDSLPPGVKAALHLPTVFTLANDASQAPLRLEVGAGQPLSRWVYSLVAPFPTLASGVSSQDLLNCWQGKPSGPFAGSPLLVDEGALQLFSRLWGEPAAAAVQVFPADKLLDAAWKQQDAWVIVPFEAVEPRWKVLEIDGNSPLHKDFNLEQYPLVVPLILHGGEPLAEAALRLYGPDSPAPLLPPSNRDPQRLAVVAMTGVTALVRATAATMEQKGILYPGKDVRDWLRSADLTHISNEVPFARNCPAPDPFQADMRFCSDPRYIALLEDVGTNVVELTGDHFQDWGESAMLYTLEMYRQRGWGYYGGGENQEDGRRALKVEVNGNRLAFVGCNAKGGSYAQAGPNHPGAVPCAGDWMAAEIRKLREQGYLPIATFQHAEYYTYQAQPDEKRDFRSMAEAGAVIVSGSQAHQPQAFEFDKGALIHYGLGNLFFDQYDVSLATRQAFIDRHVFYDGRYLGVELLPIMFVDYARPRPMTSAERNDLLRSVFSASGW
jgi:Bacterial capsule synthesis protein PGA_cap